jgi:hypothetical protein
VNKRGVENYNSNYTLLLKPGAYKQDAQQTTLAAVRHLPLSWFAQGAGRTSI